MPIDLAHILRRMTDQFNSESRFYWPFVIAVFVAIVVNTVWYYWRPRSTRPSPAEVSVRPWAYWINVIVLIWALVLTIAKVPFYWYLISFAINVVALIYIYVFYLPPQDAAWGRELRRQKYIPKAERRKRRR
ncbi:MAG: hypothetical protein KGJ98_02245 [Chloroflexota bacterium]|nr:hypothetical protein [Chloroflexota bacterium]MDE3101036.1 hypothetical protein [Chloroflexota bacterium]